MPMQLRGRRFPERTVSRDFIRSLGTEKGLASAWFSPGTQACLRTRSLSDEGRGCPIQLPASPPLAAERRRSMWRGHTPHRLTRFSGFLVAEIPGDASESSLDGDLVSPQSVFPNNHPGNAGSALTQNLHHVTHHGPYLGSDHLGKTDHFRLVRIWCRRA